MEQFTASNGYTILARENATVDWWSADHRHQGIIQVFTHSQVWQALREFFQHERDEELGRWRWPVNPNFVVYAEDDGAHNVVNENTGSSLMSTRGGVKDYHDEHAEAARAYFDAHPVRKPWEDAKPGDVWVLTLEGDESAWTMGGKGKFEDPESTLKPDSPMITAGRRIWPVSDD